MMDDFKKFGTRNESSDPLPQAPFSEGGYAFGAIFRLTHRVRGTEYKIGDRFTYISESDSVAADPYILKIGDGIGETCFLDPQGRAVIVNADSGVVNTIFEHVERPQRTVVLEEGEEYTPPPPPPKYITAEQFLEFRKGLATVLTEIAAVVPKTGEQGFTGNRGAAGERGATGERGETGWTGYPGDKGLQGIDGATGSQGPQGERGTDGKAGEQGVQGERGKQGEKGDKGDAGKAGEAGEDGKVGAKGDRGDRGAIGLRGATGSAGAKGDQGQPGRTGAKGDRGREGKAGKAGQTGKSGEVGRRGATGDSGVITAKFPLVYDAAEKSIAIDEARLDKILKKILGGGRVSPQDMGWLASTGGGGKVAVYVNGGKVTPDVRTLDFTGAGVTFAKVGGRVTIDITGSGGSGGVGPQGATGADGVQGATGATGVQGATGATGVQGATGATGADGVQGATGPVGDYVVSFNGITGAITFANYAASVNGLTGAIVGVGFTSGKLSQFASTTSAELAGIVSDETGSGVLVFGTSPSITTALNTVSASFNLLTTNATTLSIGNAATTGRLFGYTGTLTGTQSVTVAGANTNTGVNKTVSIGTGSGTSGTVTLNLGQTPTEGSGTINLLSNTAVTGTLNTTGNITAPNIVTSFNGRTGALQGVSAAVAGTGISVSGATGSVTFTNTGVQTFDGITGNITKIDGGTFA
jgi:Collagen triple helix repeat (20 copies)